jgi:SNF2 family DNA or RNA helicase
MAITLKAIRQESYPASYTKGNTLYTNKKVESFYSREREGEGISTIKAKVEGKDQELYEVELTVNEAEDKFTDYRCTCEDSLIYKGMCSHCVAAALHYWKESLLQERKRKDIIAQAPEHAQKEQGPRASSPEISSLIYQYSMKDKARYFQPSVAGKVVLEPVLKLYARKWRMSFRIGIDYKYALKDLRAFLRAVEKGEKAAYGKKLSFIHERSSFTPLSQVYLSFLERAVRDRDELEPKDNYYSRPHYQPMERLTLTEREMAEFLLLSKESGVKVYEEGGNYSELKVMEGDPPLTVELFAEEEGCRLLLPKLQMFVSGNTMLVRIGGLVYCCTEAFGEDMKELCRYAEWEKNTELVVAQKDMSAFSSTLYPILQEHVYVKLHGDISAYIPEKARIKIYLDQGKDSLTCRLESEYGEKSFNLLGTFAVEDMYRDIARESRALYTARAYFDNTGDKKVLTLPRNRDDRIYQLLSTGIEQLRHVGEVYISENFKKLSIRRAPKVSVGITLSGDLLNLTLSSDKLPFQELEALLESYRQRKKYFRLKDGDFLRLEDNSVGALAELMEGLSVTPEALGEGMCSIPRYRAFYLDQVLKGSREGIEVQRDQSFKSMIRNMKSADDSDYEVPLGLRGILRNYQKVGYRWLCTLESMGFGGILADDMGLGKTVQMIAFLSAKYESHEDRKPALIVCPASLVYNWEGELERFAPHLRKQVLAGTSGERNEIYGRYTEYQILITSYDILKRDREVYESMEFYCEVLDEAQYIKNHMTQAARAAKSIHARTKFALTGTPIENRLSELWSIFDYLMPGLLGKYAAFQKEYELPIVNQEDEIAARRLQRMIKPFVLRRLKQDVLKELPDKVENVVYSRLRGEQKKLYTANVQKLLEQLGASAGERDNKFQVLAQLTRLRQLCCDPGLVYEDYKGESAKLDTCMELVDNAIEGGHKVLIFSQFTSMLEILRKRLKKKKIEYHILTGSTKKEERAELVKQFNEDEVPVFLISLKAGGTGLNLTAATIVIHFDPWWNIAAQNQATDRTHRIGQEDTVTVFKLIAKDTVEEKILKLQEDKKLLSDHIISEHGVSVAAMSREELLGLLKEETQR